MSKEQEILQTLRYAAAQQEWNSCRESIMDLLPQMDQEDTLQVLLNPARHFLTDLSDAIPQDAMAASIKRLLVNVSSYEDLAIQGHLIDKALEDKYDHPGTNSYRNALRKVAQLERFEYPSDEYFDTWVDILSGILMGILTQAWGHRHLELWQQWFYRESREAVFILAKHFWPSPETTALNALLWNRVADDFEATIQAR